ncbi:MAG: FAD:protein FMN transferase, partial [Bacteroidota bacterium]
TSGNYENYVTYDGLRYGHILDPFIGKPSSKILSSTVIADTSIEADALSTGIFVMGVEAGEKLVRSNKAVKLLAVVETEGQGEVVSTF